MQNTAAGQQEVVDKIYAYAANMLVQQKKSPNEVKKALVKQGIDESIANIVVDNLQKTIREEKKKRAGKDMVFGAIWCIGGIIVTAVTMSAASNGGTYVVAWGAIAFGAVQFFRGLANNNA